MYDYRDAMYKKANTYFYTAIMLEEHGILDESLLIETQIATECYLCNVLENIRKTDCDHIFGRGDRIPHNGSLIYDLIYQSGKEIKAVLPKYDPSLRKLIHSAFEDYKSIRYPKDTESLKGIRIVDEESIIDDFNVMREVKDFADQFREKYFELENEIEVTNEK